MSLPTNFSGMPGEELHRHFRNTCIEFKKLIESSTDVDTLLMEMEKFLHTNQKMTWEHHPSAVYHKEEGEKAIGRVYREFKRYIKDLKSNPQDASAQDLLEALSVVEKLIQNMQVH